MKAYGANIVCAHPGCGAQPFPPEGSGLRESFDVVRVHGQWLCELHRDPKQIRKPRAAAATPLELVEEVEQLVEDEAEHSKIARVVARLKRALAPPRPDPKPHAKIPLASVGKEQADLGSDFTRVDRKPAPASPENKESAP